MKIRFVLVGLLCAGMLASGAAQASVVTYDFAMTISSVLEYDGSQNSYTYVNSSSMSGESFAEGDIVHGRFSYDTVAMIPPYLQPPVQSTGSLVWYENLANATVTFDRTGFVFKSRPNSGVLQVGNDASSFGGGDFFSLSILADEDSPGLSQELLITLFDSSASVFRSARIPDALPLSAFEGSLVNYRWLRWSDFSQMNATGSFSSLTLVNTIPEPGSLALISVALSCFFVFSRKQKAVKR